MFTILPFSALAHETTGSGPTKLFIHLEPNDAPKPGEQATIYPNLTSTEKGFSVSDCDCTMTISKDGQTVLTQKLASSEDKEAFGITPIPFVFPTEGAYDISVTGKPLKAGAFTAFTLDLDAMILTTALMGEMPHGHAMSHGGHMVHYVLFGAAIVGSIGILVAEERKKYDLQSSQAK